MNVDNPKPKIIPKLKWEDFISEHERESCNYSQSDIQKSYKSEEEKKLELSDESSVQWQSYSWKGDYSCSDVQSDQDSDQIQELRDASNFSEKEIRYLLKSFFETNLSDAEVRSKKINGLSRTKIYQILKKLRETDTINRKPESGRKCKNQDDIFEKVKAILKDDSILSAGEI